MAQITVFPTGVPVGRSVQVKISSLARTDTTAKLLCVLPKYAEITGIKLQFDTASDAGTTAVVKLGTTSANANEIVTSQNVKVAGVVWPSINTGQIYTVLTADTPIYGIYAETGGASTTGGPFNVEVSYIMTGPGKV